MEMGYGRRLSGKGAYLETFLGGMEIAPADGNGSGGSGLETFLGGMEICAVGLYPDRMVLP
mgnify:CR=1 FL=1